MYALNIFKLYKAKNLGHVALYQSMKLGFKVCSILMYIYDLRMKFHTYICMKFHDSEYFWLNDIPQVGTLIAYFKVI
jgi:hypothetical protein